MGQIASRVKEIKQTMGQIASHVKEIKQMEEILKESKQENTYFVGSTGAGKTTLIKYLVGARLTYKKHGIKYRIYQENDQSIGNTYSSCTTIPKIYNQKYVDFPGYNDTRGVTQQITNIYATSKLFRKGSKIKIVLMVEFSSWIQKKATFLWTQSIDWFKCFQLT